MVGKSVTWAVVKMKNEMGKGKKRKMKTKIDAKRRKTGIRCQNPNEKV